MEQKSSGDGVQIQSARDTIIGITPAQMGQIMKALADQLPTYAALARETVDQRLKEFEARILQKFAMDEAANAEAFKDPDFQYLLTRGFHAYARSGDTELGETLVDLIATRSKCEGRTRLSLTLNDAVEKTAVLTRNEIAELTLVFFVARVRLVRWVGSQMLSDHFEKVVDPLLDLIEKSDTSYSYMAAHGCGSIVPLHGRALDDILYSHYDAAFSSSISVDDLKLFLEETETTVSDIPDGFFLKNPDGSLRLNFCAFDAWKNAQESPIPEASVGKWETFSKKFTPEKDKFLEEFANMYKSYAKLKNIWDRTPIKQFVPTATGLAIGHANYRHLTGLNPALGIWIK